MMDTYRAYHSRVVDSDLKTLNGDLQQSENRNVVSCIPQQSTPLQDTRKKEKKPGCPAYTRCIEGYIVFNNIFQNDPSERNSKTTGSFSKHIPKHQPHVFAFTSATAFKCFPVELFPPEKTCPG